MTKSPKIGQIYEDNDTRDTHDTGSIGGTQFVLNRRRRLKVIGINNKNKRALCKAYTPRRKTYIGNGPTTTEISTTRLANTQGDIRGYSLVKDV